MKTTTIILCLLATAAFGQKIGEKTYDPFTKTEHVSSVPETLAGTTSPLNKMEYEISSVDGTLYLTAIYKTQSLQHAIEGYKLLFLFEDGAVVEAVALTGPKGYPNRKNGVNYGYALRVGYSVSSDDDWERLRTGKIVRVRIKVFVGMDEGLYDLDVKKDKSDLFNKVVDMMIKYADGKGS